ncbi:hypothetical protein BC831DRAFT_512884 [Entophlyctis helioformis]|nr:hypothetical protein BC831DRAFT_512884 [Entophlyctis helioformis]
MLVEFDDPPLFPNAPCYFNNQTSGIVLSSDYSCPPGYFCPNLKPADPTTLPVMCPPSPLCQIYRFGSVTCPPQGKYEPSICDPGYYCPTFKEKLKCPAGSYCPSGTVTPIKCSALSSCPEGAWTQSTPVSLLVCIAIDLILVVVLFSLRLRDIRRSGGAWTEILPAFVRSRLTARRARVPSSAASSAKAVPSASTDELTADVSTAVLVSVVDHTSAATANTTTTAAMRESKANIASLTETWRRGLNGHDLHLDFTFTDMGLQLPSGKQILQGVNGQIKSSRMTAIMGPSGAGKTTFMNVLCGKVNRTKGELFVNGNKAEIPQYKKVIGYVPQDDIMIRELTVREVVLHSAKCRLPRSWTSAEVETHVDDLLRALNLSHVAHTPIGDETTRGISGGQRKRVNIAIEMAAVPLCLFLDEPTSGLDSTAALDVADILSQVSQLGLTIVAVIHQPRIEIYRKFDDVLMIAPGGRTAYLGPTSQAKSYFESLGFEFDPNSNEADVLMDILAGKGINAVAQLSPDDLVRLWADRSAAIDKSGAVTIPAPIADKSLDKLITSIAQERGASHFMQAVYCHNRSLLQQQRLSGTILLEVFVGLFAGLLLGLATISDIELFSVMYIPPFTPLSPAPLDHLIPLTSLLMGMSIALASGSAGVSVFSEEKTVFWREASAGHSKFGYYAGKTVATFYRLLLSSLHYAAIYRILATPTITFPMVYPIVLLLFFGVYGVSALISMLVSRENARLLSVITNMFIAVFCGYGPTLRQAKNWGIIFIWELSPAKWAAEAFYSESVQPFKDVYLTSITTKALGYTVDRYAFDVLMMLVLGVAFRAVAFVLMLVINREKQR